MRRPVGMFALVLASWACGPDATEVSPASGSASDSTSNGTSGSPTTVTDSASSTGDTEGTEGTSTTATSMTSMDPTTDSTTATTDSSTTDPGSTGGTTMGVSGGSTGGGSTTGMVCMQDDTEPNDAQDGSQALPDVTCNAGALTFMGTLDGAADFDWFGLSGVWPGNCSQEAQVTVNVGQGLEVCAYVDCNAPDMDFMCGGGSTSDTAPDGDQGCCNNDAVSFRYGCMGGDQDSIIAVSVTGASAGQCLDYSGDYQLVSGNFF